MKKKKTSKFKISSFGKRNGLSTLNGSTPVTTGVCGGAICCAGGPPQPY